MSTGENSSFVPQISGNPVSSHLVAKQDEVAKDMMNFLSEGRHAEDILSALKNPDLDPRTLGRTANMLITRLPKTTIIITD
jgi:hypothetical protein